MTVTFKKGKGPAVTAVPKGGVAHVADHPVKHHAPVQQVLGPDPLLDAAEVIENLKDGEAALSKLHALMDDQAMNWLKIGGTLSKIKEKGWFGGHASFEELCWNEFGFKKSKGYDLIAIYKRLLEARLAWNEVEGLGWPKLSLICAKAVSADLDQEQFSKILETAKALKHVELKASLKAELPPTAGTQTKTLVFKPHPDRLGSIEAAIDKAKAEANTEHVTVALDHVCNVYLSPGAAQPKEKSEPESAVPIPKPGEKGYEWPSMEQQLQHLVDEHDGDHDKAMEKLTPALAAIFPHVNWSRPVLT